MRQRGVPERKKLEIDTPEGMTVPVGQAARILGVSGSTLKRRASEWGLRTFWDRRGRRYSIVELEKLKHSPSSPRKPATVSLDFDSIMEYDIPGGYRFRVYGTGANKGYLGCFVGKQADDVIYRVRAEFGGGTYYLKLIDEDRRMTGYNFTAHMEGPPDEGSDLDRRWK